MRVELVALLNSSVNTVVVVISDVLLGSSTYAIVMLVNSHLLKKFLSRIEYVSKVIRRG